MTYVNHTFTTSLALSASLQPYAGLREHTICEFPFEPKPLAETLTRERLRPDARGEIVVPTTPGLGMTPDPAVVKLYLVDVEITVNGKVLYQTPEI